MEGRLLRDRVEEVLVELASAKSSWPESREAAVERLLGLFYDELRYKHFYGRKV